MAIGDAILGLENIRVAGNPVANEFIVPDYYKLFSCKGSNCKNSCCRGWEVTIPMKQYFLLQNLSTDKKTKAKIDRAFRMLPDPMPDRYAEIVHDYETNDCLLHMENGYCLLHSKFGENSLPAVCRYYPRGIRIGYINECSLANSCERTLELLFATDKPLAFEKGVLAFAATPVKKTFPQHNMDLYAGLRKKCFEILSDRSDTFPARIMRLGRVLHAVKENVEHDFKKEATSILMISTDIDKCLDIMKYVANECAEIWTSLSEYCDDAVSYFGKENKTQKYIEAKSHLNSILPNNEILFEKMLINNLFFREFPFREGTGSLDEEFISFCGTYLFLRYLSLALMRDKDSINDFIDIMVKIFRIVSHTAFERNMVYFLGRKDIDKYDFFENMIGF